VGRNSIPDPSAYYQNKTGGAIRQLSFDEYQVELRTGKKDSGNRSMKPHLMSMNSPGDSSPADNILKDMKTKKTLGQRVQKMTAPLAAI